MLDLVSDILTTLAFKGTLYFRTSFTSPWGVEVPAYENVARFHFAHRGDCMVRLVNSGKTIRLAQGDLVVIPHGAAHALYCAHSPEPDILPLDRVLEDSGYKDEGVLVYGGSKQTDETQLVCGHFSLAPSSSHIIMKRLPEAIHIPDYGEATGSWLEATLRVIGNEAGRNRIGGDLIAQKMSEALFAQAIRTYLESEQAAEAQLSGFTDPKLSRALNAFHADPAEDWSVESLAREAGLSRTGFAVHFSRKLGLTPMQYLTSWRMQIACQKLAQERLGVSEVAAMIGYASESAFSRVFKKEVGLTPAAYRATS